MFPVVGWSLDPGVGLVYKAARTLLDLTQRDISKRTGLSTATISRIEAGKRKLTPELAEKLAKALTPKARS